LLDHLLPPWATLRSVRVAADGLRLELTLP
jgi:hypothetical protein